MHKERHPLFMLLSICETSINMQSSETSTNSCSAIAVQNSDCQAEAAAEACHSARETSKPCCHTRDALAHPPAHWWAHSTNLKGATPSCCHSPAFLAGMAPALRLPT